MPGGIPFVKAQGFSAEVEVRLDWLAEMLPCRLLQANYEKLKVATPQLLTA